MHALEQALTGAGLSEKEAKVYLATLELGSAAAVAIARKAGINRGTTYLIAENLMLRGLMSSVDRDGTRHFSSEPPAHLLARIERESLTVNERKASLAAALPELEALVKCGLPRPSVRYYEGLQGLEAMRQILYRARHEEVLSAVDLDSLRHHISVENMRAHQRTMKSFDLGGRVLYTCSDPASEETAVAFHFRVRRTSIVASAMRISRLPAKWSFSATPSLLFRIPNGSSARSSNTRILREPCVRYMNLPGKRPNRASR